MSCKVLSVSLSEYEYKKYIDSVDENISVKKCGVSLYIGTQRIDSLVFLSKGRVEIQTVSLIIQNQDL